MSLLLCCLLLAMGVILLGAAHGARPCEESGYCSAGKVATHYRGNISSSAFPVSALRCPCYPKPNFNICSLA